MGGGAPLYQEEERPCTRWRSAPVPGGGGPLYQEKGCYSNRWRSTIVPGGIALLYQEEECYSNRRLSTAGMEKTKAEGRGASKGPGRKGTERPLCGTSKQTGTALT